MMCRGLQLRSKTFTFRNKTFICRSDILEHQDFFVLSFTFWIVNNALVNGSNRTSELTENSKSNRKNSFWRTEDIYLTHKSRTLLQLSNTALLYSKTEIQKIWKQYYFTGKVWMNNLWRLVHCTFSSI